ncbi:MULTISPECIES: thymidine phosphorylase [Rhizobium]|uniref:Thymidine phosphorylase n=1 Tax=Rhizobium rhododendri TaxID=2506430 RepID=A0ABY8IGA9_9HYPH|nr:MULTISPECIES: thymidine phosphorylase [Rhizobium]MBZ5762848.1 thymidine phosphorylase [Rhizobium sp. VS19-DR96]MBZ5767570.1 thymidine phosphorylase [Rhizobium sp. VS19-DR129.2]MBZ5776256.1 thymidine phosphorylase [Rhizobium sp. VS19-DRK62.2]MBZ5786053.1 thymidine phosphorylase [Rhizobium sp. VS19-DR121]MBZ5803666.1 thymidine phosphorylase [Rhizobium sp. VS19-DR181]
MMPQEFIRRKRDGEALRAADIDSFIGALARGELSEGQIGAFAMAVWFKGMSRDETVALTLAMAHSGDSLSWKGLDKPVADKHSTGGIGDNVSLVLAPVAAACGLAVPMISGRGLGHTGGTLDKLESIPGYDITPDAARFRKVVEEAGCAIIGQTASLAPADRRLYAIRDVTATVDSVPLITASILSKKLAAGLQTLVLDVKIGNGAFMTSREEAEVLAHSLVEVANGAGLQTSALITDMNEPLADAAGNVLELRNAIECLKGDKPGTRLETLVLAFAAEMLVGAKMAASLELGEELARQALASGAAAEAFSRMVEGLGGPTDLMDRPDAYLIGSPVQKAVLATSDGWLAGCDARAIGMEVIALGGGRLRPEDKIDHRVGFSDFLPLASFVRKGDRIATVHAAEMSAAERAASIVSATYTITEERPDQAPLIVARISG